MAWQFRNDIPIYTQLIAQIQQRIVSGALLPGGAASLGAGPGRGGRGKPQHHAAGHDGDGTGGAGLQPAHRRPVCHRGRGADSALRESLARNQVKDFLEGMYQLGFQLGEIVTFVQTEGEKGHHEHSGV